MVILGAFTSHLVLVLFPLDFSPPSSIPTSHSTGVQVWIWDRVTRPPAGRTPSSCFSPSSSFSGCSVFELCLLSAHRQPEENQYWGSLLTLSYPGPSPQPLHFCWLRPTVAIFQEGVGGGTSVHRMGGACALNSALSSITSPSCGRGGRTEENVCFSSLLILCFPRFLDLMSKGGQGSL